MKAEREGWSRTPTTLYRYPFRRMYAILAAAFLLAATPSAGGGGDISLLLDASRDEIVRRATVPTPLFPQAEVRFIRRDRSVVAQTVIVSSLLKRVVAEIRGKESSVWTPGRAGHEDSDRYIGALDRAYREAEKRFRERNAGDDRRRSLLIEFILSEKHSLVAILDPEVRGNFGNLRVTERRILEILPLSRRYVWENMHEIGIDSLGWSRREAGEVLNALLPPGFRPEGNRTGQEGD